MSSPCPASSTAMRRSSSPCWSAIFAFCFIRMPIASLIGFSIPSEGDIGGFSSRSIVDSIRLEVVGGGASRISSSCCPEAAAARWSSLRKISATDALRFFFGFFCTPSIPIGRLRIASSVFTFVCEESTQRRPTNPRLAKEKTARLLGGSREEQLVGSYRLDVAFAFLVAIECELGDVLAQLRVLLDEIHQQFTRNIHQLGGRFCGCQVPVGALHARSVIVRFRKNDDAAHAVFAVASKPIY
jgi:hypothetical protein